MDTTQVINNGRYKVYFGIVAEDKEIDSPIARVWVPELLPMYRGDLKDNSQDETVVLTDDYTDIEETTIVNSTNVVEATYLNAFTNRMYPPDIRKGETVWLLRYMDSDIFKWYCTGDRDKHRGLERVRLIAVDDNKRNKELNDDNVYMIELNTRDSHILLQTATSNNETHRYRIKIDAKEGSVEVTDEMSNYIRLVSDAKQIIAENVTGSKIEVIDDVVNVHAVDTANVTAVTINVDAKNIINEKAGSMINEQAPTIDIKGDSTVNVKSNAITLTAPTTTINSPAIALNGSVVVAGGLSAGGGPSGPGCVISGSSITLVSPNISSTTTIKGACNH